MSTAHDLPLGDAPLPYGEPVLVPALRLVPSEPLHFDDAVRHVRPRLHRYAVRRLGDPHEAEELVQEALLRAYTHRDQLLTVDDLAAWTTVVTGRLVIDRLRVRGRSTSYADVPEGSRVGRDTADVVVARDEARTALDAIDAMPPRQATLLWAREVEGQSYQDLCERFGMTEPAVRSILTRARKALRKEFALRGGTVPVGGLAVLAPWIAGLGWAAKLRRAATRITAPTVLGAVGITALGGLLLSPFGAGQTPRTVPFHASQAVVTSASTRGQASQELPSRTTAAQSRSVAVRAANHYPSGDASNNAGTPVHVVNATCGPYVGGTDCNSTMTDETYVAVPLPHNPTGINYVAVQQNFLPCEEVPTNPLIVCSPSPSKGAK